ASDNVTISQASPQESAVAVEQAPESDASSEAPAPAQEFSLEEAKLAMAESVPSVGVTVPARVDYSSAANTNTVASIPANPPVNTQVEPRLPDLNSHKWGVGRMAAAHCDLDESDAQLEAGLPYIEALNWKSEVASATTEILTRETDQSSVSASGW